MYPEIKAAWVAALRSGEYTQGRGLLLQITPEGNPLFCCLGVLCDLAIKAGQAKAWQTSTQSIGSKTCDEATAHLPAVVAKWAGVNASPKIDGSTLVHWNDEERADFNKIADLIEVNL